MLIFAAVPRLNSLSCGNAGAARLPKTVVDELAALQSAAVQLLVEAVTIAEVTIVTNARPGEESPT